MRALWPALLLAVLAYVVVDFVENPFIGAFGDASATPEAHLTLWLAETEDSSTTLASVRATANGLLLDGHPATVGVLPGGASRAVLELLAEPRPDSDLLVVSSGTVADLAQERNNALVGENPLQAAQAQRLLASAKPVAVLSEDQWTVAVAPSSPIRDVAQLLAEMRGAPDGHVFATTDENWSADNLAALVRAADVDGVVSYRVFPSVEEVLLALTAGSAEVVLAPRAAILPDLRSGRLRALRWPAGMRPPSSWVELLAAPGTPTSQLLTLRRRLGVLQTQSTVAGATASPGAGTGTGAHQRAVQRLSGAAERGGRTSAGSGSAHRATLTAHTVLTLVLSTCSHTLSAPGG